MKKKAFTLIELIAVLVILAILALIVTPLVMNIIRKARISADKRSIDAYGRSIEYAIASYLLEELKFPTSVDELTIEYKGEEVVCSTTKLNSDSSVYLAGCTVGGREVKDYTYGKEEIIPTYAEYSVGDLVSYNGVTYYVIENSGSSNEMVKLLKENSLTKTEIDSLNISGLDVVDTNSYGSVPYGSTVNYSVSTVRKVVDAWKNVAVKQGDTATARLITFEELTDNLGYDKNATGIIHTSSDGTTPSWVYNNSYFYWTMSENNTSSKVWGIGNEGYLYSLNYENSYTVRPVLELSKTSDISKIN